MENANFWTLFLIATFPLKNNQLCFLIILCYIRTKNNPFTCKSLLMKKLLSLSLLVLLWFQWIYASSVLDILNEATSEQNNSAAIEPSVTETPPTPLPEPTTPTVESAPTETTQPSTLTTPSKPNKPQKTKPTQPVQPIQPTEVNYQTEQKQPETFILGFNTGKSCGDLNAILTTENKAEIPFEQKITVYENKTFDVLQEKDKTIAHYFNGIISFYDDKQQVVSKIKISEQFTSYKMYLRNNTVWIMGEKDWKTMLLAINIKKINQPSIQHFLLLDGKITQSRVQNNNLQFITESIPNKVEDMTTYEASVENGKIKIKQTPFECNDAYNIVSDKTAVIQGNESKVYTLYNLNLNDYSLQSKSFVGTNLKFMFGKDHYYVYVNITTNAPLLCGRDIQCSLGEGQQYVLLQKFDAQKPLWVHLLEGNLTSAQESVDGYLQVFTTSHYFVLNKSLGIKTKVDLWGMYYDTFFVNETPIANNKDKSIIIQDTRTKENISLGDSKTTILPVGKAIFVSVNDGGLKTYILSWEKIEIKRNVDFSFSSVNTNNLKFDSANKTLMVALQSWEEKPTEICSFEKVKIDGVVQEKENCHNETTVKPNFLGIKVFKLPTLKAVNEKNYLNELKEENLEHIKIDSKGTIYP